MTADVFDPLLDFAFIMAILWNERAGRALARVDREFEEWVDVGGES